MESLWVPDEWYHACVVCDTAFTRTARRHHCRGCGLIVCASCSPLEKVVPCPPLLVGAVACPSASHDTSPSRNDAKKQRVCVACSEVIDRTRSKLPSSEPPQGDRAVVVHRMHMVSHLRWSTRLELYRIAVLQAPGGRGAFSQAQQQQQNSPDGKGGSSPNAPHNQAASDAVFGMEAARVSNTSLIAAVPDIPDDIGSRRHRRFTQFDGPDATPPDSNEFGGDGFTRHRALTGLAQDRCSDLQSRHQETIARHEQFASLETVLKRHSLTTFFHCLFERLHTIVLSNILSLRNEHFEQGGKTAPVTIHGVPVTAHVPIFTLHILGIVRLRENASAAAICDRVCQLLVRSVLRIAKRYEEQIASLDEAGARTLAMSALARILAHAATKRCDLSSLAALQDFFAEAVLVDAPSDLPPVELTTRVPTVDTAWTDAGLFQQCGIRTSSGDLYDNVATAKYYYRLGTSAEATALSLKRVSARSVPNPIITPTELLGARDGLMRTRNASLVQYACIGFAPPDQRSWASASSTSEETQMNITLRAIRSIRDFLAKRDRVIAHLVEQCHATNEELNTINRRINEASGRLADFVTDVAKATGGIIPAELLLVRDAIDALASGDMWGIEEGNEASTALGSDTPGGGTRSSRAGTVISSSSGAGASVSLNRRNVKDYKMALWNQFCDLLLSSDQAPVVLYVHMRLRLSAVFLAALAFASVDEHEHVMGVSVPPKRQLRSIAQSWIAAAGQHTTMRTWAYADIIDHHCDLLARTVAERHREQIGKLAASSIVAFAECGVARILWLAEHDADVARSLGDGRVCAAVRRMARVELGKTVVAVSRVYLSQERSAQVLREQYLYTKAGLRRNEDGRRFIGDPTKVSADGPNKAPHSKPVKYGYLHVPGAEAERMTHLWYAGDDGTAVEKATFGTLTAKEKKKRAKEAETFPVNAAGTDTRLAIRQRAVEVAFHWPLAHVSCGPNTLGVKETFGATVRLRAPDGSHVESAGEEVYFRVITHRRSTVEEVQLERQGPMPRVLSTAGLGEEDGTTSGGRSLSSFQPHQRTVSYGSPSTALTHGSGCDHTATFRVSAAGACVVGAVYNGWMVVSNVVRVRPSSGSWAPERSTIRVEPTCCSAGNQMSARLILRDECDNIVTAMDADHFALNISTDDGDIAPGTFSQLSDGAFVCNFRPVTTGPIRVAVSVGSCVLAYDHDPLLCVPGPAEFRNAVLSFDEYEVAPGQTVRGNLLLRDAFGNRISGDEPDFDLELINGERELLQRTQVHDGEYAFDFAPSRRGIATVRAVSRRSGDFTAARIDVTDATEIDWAKCVVACLSREVFAGEKATFHFTLRDPYGNPVASIDVKDIKHLVHHPSNGSSVDVSPLSGKPPTFTFTAVLEHASEAVATIEVQGHSLTSPPVKVSAGALCWERSRLTAPRTATTGDWVPVQIDCRDRFGNPTPAQSGDFSVAAVNEGFAGSAKTVEGGGSQFGFKFLGLHSGTARAQVTYAGHQESVASVIMKPAAVSWAHSQFSCELHTLRAGEDDLVLVATFSDQFGNRAFRPDPSRLAVRVENEGEEHTDAAIVIEAPPRTSEELYKDPLPTLAESRIVLRLRLNRAGHAQAFAKLVGEDEEKAAPLVAIVATVASWEHSQFALCDEKIVAGVPLRAKLTLFDRFGNPATSFLDSRIEDVYGDAPTEVAKQPDDGAASTDTSGPHPSPQNDGDDGQASTRSAGGGEGIDGAAAAKENGDGSSDGKEEHVAARSGEDDGSDKGSSGGPAASDENEATSPKPSQEQELHADGEQRKPDRADDDNFIVSPLRDWAAAPRGFDRPRLSIDDVIKFDINYTHDAHGALLDVPAPVEFELAPCPEAHARTVRVIPKKAQRFEIAASCVMPAEAEIGVDALTVVKTTGGTVAHNDTDWAYSCTFAHAPDVVAGVPLDVIISLYDTYGNRVPTAHAVAILSKSTDARTIDSYPDAVTAEEVAAHFGATLTDAAGTVITGTPTTPAAEDGEHQIRCQVTAQAAGPAAIAVACNGTFKTSSTTTVLPATFDWAQTDMTWDCATVDAGLPCEAVVVFRDAFRNVASNRPDVESLKAVCSAASDGADAATAANANMTTAPVVELAAAPTIAARGDRVLVAFTSNKVGAFALQLLSPAEGDVPISPAQPVHVEASDVAWANVTVTAVAQQPCMSTVASPTTDAAVSEDGASVTTATTTAAASNSGNAYSLVAGERAKFLLRLRDRFGNPAWRGMNSDHFKCDLCNPGGGNHCPVAIEPARTMAGTTNADANAASTAEHEASAEINAVRVTTWALSAVATRAGDYRLSIVTTAAPNEDPKTHELKVLAGPVDWPRGCTWALDAPQVQAGAELFFQLEATDAFDNPTSSGLSPITERVTVDVCCVLADGVSAPSGVADPIGGDRRVVLAKNVSLMAQPGDGNYALNYPSTCAGELRVTMRLSGHEVAVESDPILVTAAEPNWQGSSLVRPATPAKAGTDAPIAIALCDRFANPLPPELGAEERSLVSATATHADGTPVATNVTSELNGCAGLWIVLSTTRTGSVSIAATHADDDASLRATVPIAPAGLGGAVATLSCPQTVIAGAELDFTATLLDEFGNLMTTTTPDEITVTAEPAGGKRPVNCTVLNTKDGSGSRAASSGRYDCTCILTSAVDTTLVVSADGRRLGSKTLRVSHATASAARSSLSIDARDGRTQAVAGEPFYFVAELLDAYGNPVTVFPTDAAMTCANGASAPRCSVRREGESDDGPTTSRQPSSDVGRYAVAATPSQAGTMRVDVKLGAAAAEMLSSAAVPVDPAPLHWPSCGLKTVEDRVTVGHDTAVVVMPKDRFGNPVPAHPGDFTAVIENLDANDQPLPEDEQHEATAPPSVFAGSRTLTAQVIPTRAGKARVKVVFVEASGDPRHTNVLLCE